MNVGSRSAAPSIAIIGSGPTGIYTLQRLIERKFAGRIAVFEQNERAGIGMPYRDDDNIRLMLANIASIEIPPIGETYLDWIRRQDDDLLVRFKIDRADIDERHFLPRLLLGEYFRDRFVWLVEQGKRAGIDIDVFESCAVNDIDPQPDGVWIRANGFKLASLFDRVVIATGHVWPAESESTASYFPSPWSGLVDAEIPACRVGVLGTSLSAIDAAMAVAIQRGSFQHAHDGSVRFVRDPESADLRITLMSRSGILPEADFYCPIPYHPLSIATEDAIAREIAGGSEGLLDRVFALVSQEIIAVDRMWSDRVDLPHMTADDFADAYFADRKMHDAFRWAEYNLDVVERNKAAKHTVPWRYAILRLHEVVQTIVPLLTARDRDRFDRGLRNVFVDNYAAVPSESIRRLLALRAAGVLDLLELGNTYDKQREGDATVIRANGSDYRYDVFIDARGQRPLTSKDLPFPSLRAQLLNLGEAIPDVGDDYALLAPEHARGRVAFGAIPYLIHDRPFIQGITASAEIGACIARGAIGDIPRPRRWLPLAA